MVAHLAPRSGQEHRIESPRDRCEQQQPDEYPERRVQASPRPAVRVHRIAHRVLHVRAAGVPEHLEGRRYFAWVATPALAAFCVADDSGYGPTSPRRLALQPRARPTPDQTTTWATNFPVLSKIQDLRPVLHTREKVSWKLRTPAEAPKAVQQSAAARLA